MKTDPPTPAVPKRAARETLRLVMAHWASSSAALIASSRRTWSSSQTPVLRATSARSATRRKEPSSSLTNAVPRSKLNVTIATRQPSCSSPTRFSTGMRTSSRNISLNSLTPVSVFIGRISMPGESIGITIQVMPLCLGASGSVRTSSSQ